MNGNARVSGAQSAVATAGASTPLADSLDAVRDSFAPVAAFFNNSQWRDRIGQHGVCDFAFGNPQEMPLPGFVEALKSKVPPQNKEWFALQGQRGFCA